MAFQVYTGHSEALPSEVLIGTTALIYKSQIKWKTARFGKAYIDEHGYMVCPFFVELSEIKKEYAKEDDIVVSDFKEIL